MKSLPLLAAVFLVSSCQAAEPTSVVKAELGKPAEIDGIAITFDAPKVGKLPQAPPRNGLTYKVPETKFLILSVHLKNVTDAKIINLSWIWEKTKLRDEHGNFYEALDFTTSYAVDGRIEGRIRPKAETKGVIAFEVPLENAKTLTLISDPGFHRENGDGTINDLSNSEVHIVFPNPAAKP